MTGTKTVTQEDLKRWIFDKGMWLCPYCGGPGEPNYLYCPNCGQVIGEAETWLDI